MDLYRKFDNKTITVLGDVSQEIILTNMGEQGYKLVAVIRSSSTISANSPAYLYFTREIIGYTRGLGGKDPTQ